MDDFICPSIAAFKEGKASGWLLGQDNLFETIHAQHGLLLYTQVHRYVRTHNSDDIDSKVTNLMIHQKGAAWQDKNCASTPDTGGILIDF